MFKGGYKIIDLEGANIENSDAVTVPGLYNDIESSYDKALMLADYEIDSITQPASFVRFTHGDNTYEAGIYVQISGSEVSEAVISVNSSDEVSIRTDSASGGSGSEIAVTDYFFTTTTSKPVFENGTAVALEKGSEVSESNNYIGGQFEPLQNYSSVNITWGDATEAEKYKILDLVITTLTNDDSGIETGYAFLLCNQAHIYTFGYTVGTDGATQDVSITRLI